MDVGQTITLLPISMSPGQPIVNAPPGELADIDGSVAALSRNDDGTITAEICIPGPPVP
jgi:hypothetical protein